MPISVSCGSCGAGFKVADSFAGKRGKCPKCGGVFTANSAGAPAPATFAAKSPDKQPHAGGSSVARNLSPQTSGAKHSGPGKAQPVGGQSAKAKPSTGAGQRSAKPPAPPAPRVVPVGALPGSLPVGGVPGGSSVSKAIVRPAMPMVSAGKSTFTQGKKQRRKKGTPAILWVIIVVGGISSAGGWYYVATREEPRRMAAANSNPVPIERQPEAKLRAAASDQNTANPANDESDSSPGNSRSSVVPEATITTAEVDDLDSALAGRGDISKRASGRKLRTNAPAVTATPTEKEPATDAVASQATPVTAEELTALAAACQQNAWKAESQDQYAQLAALATGMMHPADDAAHRVALELLKGPLSEIIWTTERVSRINRNAARQLDKIGTGTFLVAQVTEQVDGGALLKLVGTESLVKIEMSGAQLALVRPGKNFLLIGLLQPESYEIPAENGAGEVRRARVINALFRMGITEIYDREGSTIGPAGGGE